MYSRVAAAWCLSDDNAIRHIVPDFVYDVMFAYNRPGKGEASRAYTLKVTLQGGRTRVNCKVYDGLVILLSCLAQCISSIGQIIKVLSSS